MRAQLPDLTMAYTDRGAGLPLLLLHGYPLSRRLWRPQIEDLANAARVIAPDLRGHGDTDVPAGPYTVAQLADDAAHLLDALNITAPVVVGGLSLGGYVALAFQRRYPERTAGLILAATRAGADSPEAQANRDKAAASALEKGTSAIVDAMLPKLLAPRTYIEQPAVVDEARALMAGTAVPGIVATLAALKTRPDATPQLAGIGVPVVVIHGAEDAIIPPSEAEAAAQALPHARLVLVPSAGHLLNLEQPAAFNAAVRTYLAAL
jgi:3-oxoadipate enol-lactonase